MKIDRTAARARSIAARRHALERRHARLEAKIAQESARPLPDPMRVQWLKRIRLRLKDEVASLEGVLRTLSRARQPGAG